MTRTTNNPWLHRFACGTALATLGLIGIGGLVTSHEAGMAVPDWPTSYGYNMFLFPPSYWIGGILYEHTHRLFASFVGLLTVILAGWLWMKEARSWVRWLGIGALIAVVFQGVLGGLRVTLFKDEIGIFHAALAQLFFVLTSLIALFTSRVWMDKLSKSLDPFPRSLTYVVLLTTVLIFVQLILGATMRHQHAGLAVPDFPLAYGHVWPPLDSGSIEGFNRQRIDTRDFNPITAAQIVLHMSHRWLAFLIVFAVCFSSWRLFRNFGNRSGFSKLGWAWVACIILQAVLGATTVLSNKAADVATLHVVGGAACLAVGALLSGVLIRSSANVPVPTAVNITANSAASSRKFATA